MIDFISYKVEIKGHMMYKNKVQYIEQVYLKKHLPEV